MAYTTDLKPAWPSAVLDDPARPAVVAPRLADRRRRRRVDARHDRRDDEHRVLRHRLRRRRSTSRSLRPGSNPRTNVADRGRPAHGQAEVVAAADRRATSGRTTSRSRRSSTTAGSAAGRGASSRSATKEGVWFAFDARTGQPFHERVKVIDRVEHPPLRPGPAGDDLPGARSAASTSRPPPTTRRRTTSSTPPPRRARPDPEAAHADAEAAQVPARGRLPGSRERQLRPVAAGLEGLTARSARSTSPPAGASGSSGRRSRSAAASRRPRADSASPAAATASCARSTSGPARSSGVPDGRPIAAGPTIFSAGGKAVRRDHRRRYADVVERRHRLAAPGLRARRDPEPPAVRRGSAARAAHRLRRRAARAARAPAATAPRARIAIEGAAVPLALWRASTSNQRAVTGRVLHGGRPVAGARVSVDRYVLPRATDAAGPVHGDGRQHAGAETSRFASSASRAPAWTAGH